MQLYNGDCLEIMKDLSKNSIDIVICDLPYGRFKHLEWDIPLDLERMWNELWRICKPTTPIFLFGDFKFCMKIYNSQPKYFKYEIVWNKGVTTTPLLSRKRFGKATEYILVFYKKQCIYNYSKYHKIIKKERNSIRTNKAVVNFKDMNNKIKNNYDPKLPLNVIDCSFNNKISDGVVNYKRCMKGGARYEPVLPLNVIEENEIIDKYKHLNHRGNKLSGKHNEYDPKLPLNIFKCNSKRNKKTIKKITEKPQPVLEHLLKYFSNEGDTCLDMCMGSGSMGVACKTLNRNFIGIEKNKEFFDITKERLIGDSFNQMN